MGPQPLHLIEEPSDDGSHQAPSRCDGCSKNLQAILPLDRHYSFEDPVEYVFNNVAQVPCRSVK